MFFAYLYHMICNCDQCELRAIFFENVDASELENICAQKVEKNYLKGDHIIQEGDRIDDFIYLKSGLVKLFRTRKEDDQIIAIAKPFDFVSLLSVFSETKYNYSVTAIEDSTTCVLKLADIKHRIQTNGKFALGILDKMSRATDSIIINMLNIREKNLRGRIAYLVIYFSKNVYMSPTFELPISRQEIAELINMTSENVIRIFSEFRKDNVLETQNKAITILDMPRLEKIAELG